MSRYAFIAAAVAAFGLSAPAAQAEQVLNFAHTTSLDSHYHDGVAAFKTTLEKLSGGEFVIREQAAGALGGERDLIEGLQIGSVELVFTSTGPLGNFVPDVLVLDLPFLFASYDNAHKILDGEIGQELLAKVDEHNLHALAWAENGFRHVTNSNHAVNSPADLKGLKLRTMENQIHMAAFTAAGAAPTPMAFPEVFAALQQHVVDGQENPISVIKASKFFEVQKYLTLTGHVYSPAIILASPSLWDGLSDEQKGWFNAAAKDAVAANRARVAADEAAGVAYLRDKGMEVITKVDTDAFRAAVRPAYGIYTKAHGEEMLNRIIAAQAN